MAVMLLAAGALVACGEPEAEPNRFEDEPAAASVEDVMERLASYEHVRDDSYFSHEAACADAEIERVVPTDRPSYQAVLRGAHGRLTLSAWILSDDTLLADSGCGKELVPEGWTGWYDDFSGVHDDSDEMDYQGPWAYSSIQLVAQRGVLAVHAQWSREGDDELCGEDVPDACEPPPDDWLNDGRSLVRDVLGALGGDPDLDPPVRPDPAAYSNRLAAYPPDLSTYGRDVSAVPATVDLFCGDLNLPDDHPVGNEGLWSREGDAHVRMTKDELPVGGRDAVAMTERLFVEPDARSAKQRVESFANNAEDPEIIEHEGVTVAA